MVPHKTYANDVGIHGREAANHIPSAVAGPIIYEHDLIEGAAELPASGSGAPMELDQADPLVEARGHDGDYWGRLGSKKL
jgi:hypothetical protein